MSVYYQWKIRCIFLSFLIYVPVGCIHLPITCLFISRWTVMVINPAPLCHQRTNGWGQGVKNIGRWTQFCVRWRRRTGWIHWRGFLEKKLMGFKTCITITRTIQKPHIVKLSKKINILLRNLLMFGYNSLRVTVLSL